MNIELHDSVDSFLKNTESELVEHEINHILIYGLARHIRNYPDLYKNKPLLLTASGKRGMVIAGLMTPPQKLILDQFMEIPITVLKCIAVELCNSGYTINGILAESALAREFARIWISETGSELNPGTSEQLHYIDNVNSLDLAEGIMTRAVPGDIDLLEQWFNRFRLEISDSISTIDARKILNFKIENGDIFLWSKRKKPVSMAARSRPGRNGIILNLVYTPEPFRNRGYSTSLISSLSRNLLESGYRFCSLFSDKRKSIPNRIYKKVGYRPVADYQEYYFENRP